MCIAGIGTAVPTYHITQADAAEITRHYTCDTEAQHRLFVSLYQKSGVEKRHSAVLEQSTGELADRQSFYGEASPTTRQRMEVYEREAGALAIEAARAALDDAAVPARRITHLVTVSCSGFHAPGFDIAVIKDLGLPPGVARTHVGFMGCHGALNALRVANAFVGADPAACVLVCAVELCSLHHQYAWNVEHIVANALFADGAAAVVGIEISAAEARSPAACRVLASGSTVIEDSQDAMSWRISDHGFEMTLSKRVPELIGVHVRPWLDGWLGQYGLTVETVGSWAVHPGGPRILAAFGEAAGLDPQSLAHSRSVLADFGNMSSPTILFILERLRAAGAPRPSVALAFGPGLAVEAAILN
jgi:predicted naringenin-chalcone synthase